MAIIFVWMLSTAAILCCGSPTTPSQDPFYEPPSGFELSPPGTIFKSRNSPYPHRFPIDDVIDQGHQILYRTADTFDGAASNNSYDHLMGLGHRLVIAAALSQGWIVTITDHEGPRVACMANIRGVDAVLDGVRASLSSGLITGISPGAQVALMSYSARSSPTALATEIQSSYAPELASNLIGVAIGGLLPSLREVMDFLVFDWTVAASMWGLAREYPSMLRLLQENMRPEAEAQAQFMELGSVCAGDLINKIGNLTWHSYFTSMDFLKTSDAQQIFRQNSMYQGAPGIPVFVYESAHDNTSPNVEIDRLVAWYCAAGTNMPV